MLKNYRNEQIQHFFTTRFGNFFEAKSFMAKCIAKKSLTYIACILMIVIEERVLKLHNFLQINSIEHINVLVSINAQYIMKSFGKTFKRNTSKISFFNNTAL